MCPRTGDRDGYSNAAEQFHAQSTSLVASAFLALRTEVIGWSLMEILARSLFAGWIRSGRRWWQSVIPVLVNIVLTVRAGSCAPSSCWAWAHSIGRVIGCTGVFHDGAPQSGAWLRRKGE